jgi:hypothetical protein
MKLPRFTVRNLMFITAIFAVGLFVAQEFWEGMPPRSVVRGIPARIARLEPGMTFRQVHDILGLEKSWLKEKCVGIPYARRLCTSARPDCLTHGAFTMSATTPTQPAHSPPISEAVDASENLYRMSVDEYERIGELLDDSRVELIDGLLVAKMVKNPPHQVACVLAHQALAPVTPSGWHLR